MLKKIIFSGCSTTAGNELYEEEHVQNYKKMSFKEARTVKKLYDDQFELVESYNYENSYPALVGEIMGAKVENISYPGQSNKEIVGRIIAYFDKDWYEDTAAIIQMTTLNRFFIKYKEDNNIDVVGSFVAVPDSLDDKLTRNQNNILQEMMFEFFPESLLVIDDIIYFNYAIEYLRAKNVKCFITMPDGSFTDWLNWKRLNGNTVIDDNYRKEIASQLTLKEVVLKNDRDPIYLTSFVESIARKFVSNNLIPPWTDFLKEDCRLPRHHFDKESHHAVAEKMFEELRKC